jgi:hypothetical protein
MKSRRNNPERDGEFGPAEMQEGYHALNRTSVTFFTVVRRRKAHSFLRREMSPSGPISDISHRRKTASVFADHRQCLTANVAKLPETILVS